MFGRMGVTLLVSAVVLVSVGWATDVSGDITTDTTWRAADSPFIIRTSISVRNNATLTIEAGVVVRFAGNFTLTIQSGSRLVAQGQADRLIQFIPDNEAGAGPSAYRGIVFENGSTGLMAFCVVDRAHDGVTIRSSVNEGEVTLSNCTFQRCGASGVVVDASTVIRPVIENCTFQDSTYGVFVWELRASWQPLACATTPSAACSDLSTSGTPAWQKLWTTCRATPTPTTPTTSCNWETRAVAPR
jgi:hypothetical protein